MNYKIPEDGIEVEEEEFRKICHDCNARRMAFSNFIFVYYIPNQGDVGYEDETNKKFYIDKQYADEYLTMGEYNESKILEERVLPHKCS